MSEDLSKENWSKQFYKALEAVGSLTEQERFKLGNMLISLSPLKKGQELYIGDVPTFPPNARGGYQTIQSSGCDDIKSPPRKP